MALLRAVKFHREHRTWPEFPVTTVIPAYNSEQYIAEAIDSVVAQRGVAAEIVVVDDGSTDETRSIVQSYGDRVRLLSQENRGPAAARNYGTSVARGEWIAFLDSDDAWLPEKLARQLALVDRTVGMVYTDRRNFGDIGRVRERGSQSFTLWEGDIFEPLLLSNFITTSSALIRKDWFDRLGGFDEELMVCEDWDLWLRFAAAGGIARVCREPLTRYRWSESSATNNQLRMCEGRVRVLERALASACAAALPAAEVRRARASVWKCSAWHAAEWRRSVAFRWYARAAFYWPWDGSVYKQMIKCFLPRADGSKQPGATGRRRLRGPLITRR